MEDYKRTFPITAIVICIFLSLVGPVFQIEFEPIDWLYFSTFFVCYMLFSWTIDKTVDYIVFSNFQVSKSKLTLHETMERATPHFDQIERVLTQKRNRTICHEIGIFLMQDMNSDIFYTDDMIQTCIENRTIFDIIEKSSISRKHKRWCRGYLKKYNNNTADLDELKIAFKTKKLLKNDVDMKAILGFAGGILFGVIGAVSLSVFVDLLYKRIIGLVVVLIIETARAVDRYRNQKRFYLKYYSDKNTMFNNVIAIIEQKKTEENKDGQTENAQHE